MPISFRGKGDEVGELTEGFSLAHGPLNSTALHSLTGSAEHDTVNLINVVKGGGIQTVIAFSENRLVLTKMPRHPQSCSIEPDETQCGSSLRTTLRDLEDGTAPNRKENVPAREARVGVRHSSCSE